MEATDPGCMPNLEHRGMVGRIYVRNHWTLLYTKYICCWPNTGFREDFFFFPIISQWEPLIKRHGQFGHQELDWQDLFTGTLDISVY